MSDPTRHIPPTYEHWIETHSLDWSDLETPSLGNEQTRTRRINTRRAELRNP